MKKTSELFLLLYMAVIALLIGQVSNLYCREVFGLDNSWTLNLLDMPEGSQGESVESGTLPPPLDERIASDNSKVSGPPTFFTDIYLPHTWDAINVLYPVPGIENRTVGYYSGSFKLPLQAQGNLVILHFESVFLTAEVWVNRKPAGSFTGAYLPFDIDVTDLMVGNSGESQEVIIRVDSRSRPDLPPPTIAGWYAYGRIDRDIRVIIMNSVHLDEQSVWAPYQFGEEGSVTVHSEMAVINEDSVHQDVVVETSLLDNTSAQIFSMGDYLWLSPGDTTTLNKDLGTLVSPLNWKPGSPNLYQLRIVLYRKGQVIDEIKKPVGFRFLEFDPNQGVFINGLPLILKGFNAHQEYVGFGSAVPIELQRRDMRLLAGLGANFFRTSHYPRHPDVLAVCDTLGLFVMEELPLWHGSIRKQGGDALLNNAERLFRTMVRRDRAHPCIIIWGTANEPLIRTNREDYPLILSIVERMNEIAKEEDPNRWTSYVTGSSWQRADKIGLTCITDLVGYNGYLINSINTIDSLHERYPDRKAFMSEGPGGGVRSVINSELEQVSLVIEVMQGQNARSWFPGGAFWSLTDYGLPIAKRWNIPGIRATGVFDAQRIEKDSAFFFRSQWTETPMVHIMGHWTLPGQEGKKITVTVFSNTDEIRMYLNSKEVGRRKANFEMFPNLTHPPYQFSIAYAPGTLIAAGFNGEIEVVREQLNTAGNPEKLELILDGVTVKSGTRKAVPVQVFVRDANGITYPIDRKSLEVSVDGPGRAVYIPDLKTTQGTASFIVESDGIPGNLDIQVKSPPLISGNAILEIVP